LGGTQSRGNPSIYGDKKVGSLFKGKKTKAPYANSINESAELSEADLSEQDLIVVPGQGRKLKTGFIPHGTDRTDHEVEMARGDLFQAAKNAQQVFAMIKDIGEEEGLEGWVQEKIIKANDYLNTVREYYEGKQVQGVDESIENNSVANTIISHVMKHRPDLLKYGADRVGDAIDRIASRVGNVKYISPDNLNKLIKQVEYYVTSNNHDMYEGVQRGDTLVTDALKLMRGAEVNDAVKALKTVLGDRAYNERRGFYNFYIKQMIDMYGQQGVAEGKRNLKCVCKTHGTMQCPVHTPKDIDVLEGAKVDRMVKHVAKSEKKLGHSKKEAENIAWATANKRGMLDNKNKKA
jgi:hypothetical protein